jgi:DNA-binding response OmpR family regulator
MEEAEERDGALAAGFDEYLEKPFRPADLVAKLEALGIHV